MSKFMCTWYPQVLASALLPTHWVTLNTSVALLALVSPLLKGSDMNRLSPCSFGKLHLCLLNSLKLVKAACL